MRNDGGPFAGGRAKLAVTWTGLASIVPVEAVVPHADGATESNPTSNTATMGLADSLCGAAGECAMQWILAVGSECPPAAARSLRIDDADGVTRVSGRVETERNVEGPFIWHLS